MGVGGRHWCSSLGRNGQAPPAAAGQPVRLSLRPACGLARFSTHGTARRPPHRPLTAPLCPSSPAIRQHLGQLTALRRLLVTTSGHFDYGTTVADLAFLTRLSHLESLHLGMLFLDELPASTFRHLPALTCLHLESVFDPGAALRGLPGLRKLGGRGLHMTRDTWAAVAAMTQLTSLSLADLRGEVRGMGALRALANLTALHVTTGWTLSGELLVELGPLLGGEAPATAPAAPGGGQGALVGPGGGGHGPVGCALSALRSLSLGKFIQADLPELAPGSLALLTRLRCATSPHPTRSLTQPAAGGTRRKLVCVSICGCAGKGRRCAGKGRSARAASFHRRLRTHCRRQRAPDPIRTASPAHTAAPAG